MEKAWAHKWMKCWDKAAALTKDLLAKMPKCIDSLYMEEKTKALSGGVQLAIIHQNFTFCYEIDLPEEEVGFIVVRGITKDKFIKGGEPWLSPCLFFFDELQDLAVSGIVDILQSVLQGPMAQQERATLVLFITDAQRDELLVNLTSSLFRGVIAKVMHGVVLWYNHNRVGDFGVQVLEPFMLVFVHRGDSPAIHVPKKTVTAF